MERIRELEELILKRRLRVIHFEDPKYDEYDHILECYFMRAHEDVKDIESLIRELQKLQKEPNFEK